MGQGSAELREGLGAAGSSSWLLVQGEGWDAQEFPWGAGRGEYAAGESDAVGRPPARGLASIPSLSTRDSCLGLDYGPSSAV